MKKVTVAPKGMGLHDFVAHQEGFFAAEGLDVTLDWKTFRGTQSSWKDMKYMERPQDQPYTKDNAEVIQGACVWGSICNASEGMGKFVPEAMAIHPGRLRAAGFQNPRAEGLKDVRSLGRHARRQPFQRAVPAGEISSAGEHQDRQPGGFGAPLAGALDGEVRPRACCRRRSRWRSNSACARSSRIPSMLWWVRRLRSGKYQGLSARARPRREGYGRRHGEILSAVAARGAGGFRDLSQLGLHQVRPRRALRLQTLPHSEFDEVMTR